MRIALGDTKQTPHGRMILEHIARGLRLHGDEAVPVNDEALVPRASETCDCFVTICAANPNQDVRDPVVRLRNAIEKYARRSRRRILVVDTGFVLNDIDWQNDNPRRDVSHSAEDAYLEVGFDGIKRHADYCMAIGEAPPDRWRDLHVPLLPWRSGPIRRVLLVGQTPRGASSQNIDILDWYGEAMRAFARLGAKVVYRPHPRMSKHRGRTERNEREFLSRYGSKFDVQVRCGPRLADDLADIDAVACYSSNAAVTSVLHGVPTFTANDICMAWDVSGHDLGGMDAFVPPEREAWAHRLAWAQWTCSEMASGAMWAHFRPHAAAPPRSMA